MVGEGRFPALTVLVVEDRIRVGPHDQRRQLLECAELVREIGEELASADDFAGKCGAGVATLWRGHCLAIMRHFGFG